MSLMLAGSANAEPAEPNITDPMGMIDTVTPELVSGLLSELGAQRLETRDRASGGKVVLYYENDTPFNLIVGACDVRPNKCLALAEVVVLATDGAEVSLDIINTLNKEGLFMTVFQVDKTKIGFGHVFLVDGGVTRKHLAISMASFSVTLKQVVDRLQALLITNAKISGLPPSVGYARARVSPARIEPKDWATIEAALRLQSQSLLNRSLQHR